MTDTEYTCVNCGREVSPVDCLSDIRRESLVQDLLVMLDAQQVTLTITPPEYLRTVEWAVTVEYRNSPTVHPGYGIEKTIEGALMAAMEMLEDNRVALDAELDARDAKSAEYEARLMAEDAEE